ncbi:MAG TPA: ABC transporter ATP-binding protein [Microvirga sp.]|jgi:multiple sugar transport system ATP-binding protein
MASVELVGVEKRFGTFTALQRLNLSIADGEFLVLLGPSGCGKTTTMRMVAGLEEPTAGDIVIDGERVNDALPKDRDVAMVFQNYGLYPHMSVAQNIGYPLKVRGIGGSDREARIKQAAEKVELGPLLHRKPRELSGGQRQRVALARAIVRTPRVFLMDEPLSNLDAKLRVTMRAEIKHLQHELGVTTIYVTHDQIEAMTLAHRVAVMNGGAIQQLDTPEAIYDRPANLFVAGFIGSPPMNLVAGQVVGDTFQAPGVTIRGDFTGASGKVVLGIRPEDLSITAPGEGAIEGHVYASELTGEAILVTVSVGDARLIARASRSFRGSFGTPVGLKVDLSKLHFFSEATGHRIDIATQRKAA